MEKFKKYELCPILTDDMNNWFCQKKTCPYYINESCCLSPMIEGFRGIIMEEVEKELAEEEKREEEEEAKRKEEEAKKKWNITNLRVLK